METLVLMLCAGLQDAESYSWRSETPRHLVPIAGEPLVRRTHRLIRRFGHDAVVVTRTGYIRDLFRNVFEPENDHLLYDTMLSTRELWDAADRVVFVQSDFLLYDDFLEGVFGTWESGSWEADHGPPAVVFMRADFARCEAGLRHLSSIDALFEDCMQRIRGFLPKAWTYSARSLYDMDNTRIWDLMRREQPWVDERPKPALLLLAAGPGSRLGHDMPKALQEFRGRPAAAWMLDEFARYGLSEIVASVGYKAEMVENLLGREWKGVPVTCIFNPDYTTTGSGTSITLARDKLRGRKSIVFEADQIVCPELVRRLVQSPALDAVLADDDPDPRNDPGVWLVGTDGVVDDVLWPAPSSRPDLLGNAPYFLKLSEGGTELLCEFEDDGGVESLRAVADRLPVHAVSTSGLPWAHFNTPQGLGYARDVFPLCKF